MPRLRLLALAWLTACSGSSNDAKPPKDAAPDPANTATNVAPAPTAPVEIPMVELKTDPSAGDKAVSAELGGPGFTGEGWQTATKAYALGDPKAIQGGHLTMQTPDTDWPVTLRLVGKDSNIELNQVLSDLCYESLLVLDPVSKDYLPQVASHWQISADKSTYRFRIDPRARFSDGVEITADDVVASWKLLMDPTLLDPASVLVFGKFDQPKVVSKYVVEVKVKEESWRNFYYFATNLPILPAHQISTGDKYLTEFQWKLTASSGPYTIKPEDVKTGESVTFTRRKDWWGEDNPMWDGWWNIDQIQYVVVKDPNLGFEKLKKGELDYLWVQRSVWWAQDLPEVDAVKNGWLVPEKFFNDSPQGFGGIAMQEQTPPLDDRRVRLALQYLLDRPTMIKKLFLNEYTPMNSYFPGEGANPDNEEIGFDPTKAVSLLEEAGWKDIDKGGYRTKDGKELALKLSYDDQNEERYLTVYQEDCKKAGVKIEFDLLTPAAGWKNRLQKEFQLMDAAWSGTSMPTPDTMWLSDLAKVKDNNNVTGFVNPEVDSLIHQYDLEYDIHKRTELLRKIDGIVYNDHPYALFWGSGNQRMVYWNKFGMPAWGVPRLKTRDELFDIWWVDPAKEKALADARANGTKLETPPREQRFWQEYGKSHVASDAAAEAPAPPAPK